MGKKPCLLGINRKEKRGEVLFNRHFSLFISEQIMLE